MNVDNLAFRACLTLHRDDIFARDSHDNYVSVQV